MTQMHYEETLTDFTESTDFKGTFAHGFHRWHRCTMKKRSRISQMTQMHYEETLTDFTESTDFKGTFAHRFHR
ncbi:MAG: hypothetical protein K5854_00160 [Prevotella sp.]|nr:hypothetical protein [Prevotella sp.]